jgi:hypothetical protein
MVQSLSVKQTQLQLLLQRKLLLVLKLYRTLMAKSVVAVVATVVAVVAVNAVTTLAIQQLLQQ